VIGDASSQVDREPSRALDRSSPLPLWAQLGQILQDRLDAGAWDGRFPTELELCQEYGVSRQTVRQSLRRLREDGRVVSERGRGSRQAGVHEQTTGALWSLFRSVEASGNVQTSDVRHLEAVQHPRASADLGLDAATWLLFLERVRRVDGDPVARDRAWLPLVDAEPLLESDFTHTALYDELARRCGITLQSGEETIGAISGDQVTRRLLQVPTGTPLLTLFRRGFYAGRAVEVRRTEIRADRVQLHTAWQPTGVRSLSVHGTFGPGPGRPRRRPS
jgi:GntR family transcriptional regulator